MLEQKLHFSGTIWRPPFEANSQLIQVTTGCSHNKCKFCSMYHNLSFKVSPISEIEADLKIIRHYNPNAKRVFLVGANPFVLSYNKLNDLAILIKQYLPKCESIGSYARITDFKLKTVEELKSLRQLGYSAITIGIESGDDTTLARMNKGVTSQEILTECHKLDQAQLEYSITYLNNLAGQGNGMQNALKSAEVYNQLNPLGVFIMSLIITPNSELNKEIQEGKYVEASLEERVEELKTFIDKLTIKTFMGINVSYLPALIRGELPENKSRILGEIQTYIEMANRRNTL